MPPLAVRLRRCWLLVDGDRELRLPLPPHATAKSVPISTSPHVAARIRAVEEAFAGHTQYVVLGAGLDTSGYDRPDLRVYEVDRADAQQWKRAQLACEPAHVAYVACDFERDDLAVALAGAGYRPDEPALFSWLGVTGYLTRPAVERILRFVGTTAPGTEIVFDYTDPDAEDDFSRAMRDLVELVGEPILSVFRAAEVDALLAACGLHVVRNQGCIARARVPDRLP
ncbi:MAG TPA: SAM-dependent methyltransferase [Acidimicrobiales bacterium]|nr:SAM-dependent methyltransferase [Acidimicrobiales bacterium]